MKIIKFKAGLGNQMFQYAFLRYIEIIHHTTDVKVDLSYFKKGKFVNYYRNGIVKLKTSFSVASDDEVMIYKPLSSNCLPATYLYRFFSFCEYKFNKKCFFEKDRSFINFESIRDYDYFDGYWQSWKYLEPIREILINDFQPKEELSIKSKEAIKFYSRNKMSVFVGVRRGEGYVTSRKDRNHFGSCSIDYYLRAVSYMKTILDNPLFVFFSNDIEWVKENLNQYSLDLHENQIMYREKNDITNDFEELFVMSSCNNAIISNSTFNFWGAWLIQNKDKVVVAPKQWFNDGSPIDIIPKTWISM